MAEDLRGAVKPSNLEQSEHVSVNGTGAKRVLVGGSDGTDIQDISVDSDGVLGIAGAKQSLQSHFEAITSWTESAGADNIAVSVEHRGAGTKSIEFDKIAGNAIAMVSKTVTSFDMGEYSTHAIGIMHIYISSLTNVANCFVRIGTDSSNYCQWDFSDTILSAGWNQLQAVISMPTSQTGNGYNLDAVTYIAIGVTFDDAANTLTDIRTCGWTIKRVLETSTTVNADVTVDTAWVGIKDQNSNTRLDVATGASYNYLYNRNTDGTNLMPTGDADARAISVNLGANNDVTVTNATATNLKCEEASASAIKTAVEIIDDWDDTDKCKVSIPVHATRVQGKVDNADTTTAREVLAAVASNYVYITSFIISVAAAGSYWLEDGDAAQLTSKFTLAANGGVSWTAWGSTPYKTTTVNKAINVKGSAAGAVGVMLTGYTATT